jgi:septal ring factor EnvC (AmiA/AmiB activator)
MDPDILARAAKYHTTVVSNKNRRIQSLKAEIELLRKTHGKVPVEDSDRLSKEVEVQGEEIAELSTLCAELRRDIKLKDTLLADYSRALQGLQKAYVERTKEVQALRKQISSAQTFGESLGMPLFAPAAAHSTR